MSNSPAVDRRAGLFGIGWTTLAHFVAMALSLGSSYILTRLLAPEDYGVFAASLVAVLIINLVSDLGVRPGLMRHPRGMTPEFLGTGWIINLRRGMVLGLILFAFSFLLPSINDSPRTGPVLRVLALLPIIHALQSPAIPVLYFQMKYRQLACIEIGQNVIRVAGGIVAAVAIGSEWALVIGVLSGEIGFVLLSYLFSPQWSRPKWNHEAAAELHHFGWQVFWNTAIMALWWHADRLFALNFISETEMGVYAVAWALSENVERLISRIVDVYFSLLSRQPSDEMRTAMHQKISRWLGLAAMPALAVGILLAPLAIRILYPQSFRGAQLLFALLMARQMFRMLGMVQFQYLLVRAEVRLATFCYLLALAVMPAVYLPLIIRFGAEGMAWSAIATTGAYALFQYVIFVRRGILNWWPLALTLFWMAAGIAGVFWILG